MDQSLSEYFYRDRKILVRKDDKYHIVCYSPQNKIEMRLEIENKVLGKMLNDVKKRIDDYILKTLKNNNYENEKALWNKKNKSYYQN